MARQGFGAGNCGAWIKYVAEGDGAHWACKLAGGLRRAVRQEQILVRDADGGGGLPGMFLHQTGFVPDFGALHHLDAIGAFFHDAAGADRHIRVALEVRGLFRCPGVVKEVEAARLVRAVGGAVPRSPAPGVHHGVEPFRGVDGGVDRADGFARSPAALLAGHGYGGHGSRVREVLVDAYPVQGAPFRHLVASDHGYVVFRPAGHQARVAADAA